LFAVRQARPPAFPPRNPTAALPRARTTSPPGIIDRRGLKTMAKIAKTADRKKIMDTSKSTDCPKCGKPTRIVKRVKDRERGVPGGVFISCSACDFYEKL
jgi:RNase P subunit RPR2